MVLSTSNLIRLRQDNTQRFASNPSMCGKTRWRRTVRESLYDNACYHVYL
jgi:hypothetical protein